MADVNPRERGKRSDPNYTQISGYIPRKLYHKVKVRCAEEELQISEVLERLLEQWLKTK